MEQTQNNAVQLWAAICEDEPQQADYLQTLLRQWQRRQPGLQLGIRQFTDAAAFLACRQPVFQLLLLDIQMPGMNGMQLARTLRAQGDPVQIVFITGYAEHMGEGYEVEALHYLLKPIEPPRLFTVLDRALTALRQQRAAILLPTVGGSERRFFLDEVRWLEAFSHTLQLHTAAGAVEIPLTMEAAQQRLGAAFFRCHRSYLVNMGCVCQVRRDGLLLDDGACLPLSRRLYRQAGQAFLHFHRAGEGQP